MQPNHRTLEEFLDDETLLLQAPEFLDYEELDLEQDLRHEIVLCEPASSILARMHLASLLQLERSSASLQPPAAEHLYTQRVAARQDEVQLWEL